MHPSALARLRKAKDTAAGAWVEVSADDVLEAAGGLEKPDPETSRLQAVCGPILAQRVAPRRGPPVPVKIVVQRKDLEHLLARVDEPKEPEPEPEAEPSAAPHGTVETDDADSEGGESG